MLWYVRIGSNMFGYVQKYLHMLRYVQMHSSTIRYVQICTFWYVLVHFNIFWYIWICSDTFGYVWILQKLFEAIVKCGLNEITTQNYTDWVDRPLVRSLLQKAFSRFQRRILVTYCRFGRTPRGLFSSGFANFRPIPRPQFCRNWKMRTQLPFDQIKLCLWIQNLENVLKSWDMFKYIQIYLYRSMFIRYVKTDLDMFWIGLDRFR